MREALLELAAHLTRVDLGDALLDEQYLPKQDSNLCLLAPKSTEEGVKSREF